MDMINDTGFQIYVFQVKWQLIISCHIHYKLYQTHQGVVIWIIIVFIVGVVMMNCYPSIHVCYIHDTETNLLISVLWRIFYTSIKIMDEIGTQCI